jgi:hypothetical protein
MENFPAIQREGRERGKEGEREKERTRVCERYSENGQE